MIGYKLDIRHDGDFYHERPYNIVLHENELEAIKLVIQALQAVHDTISASREYLNGIKEHIGEFLDAYNSDVVSYVDDRYDIWFVRQGDMFEFGFDLDNGNQQVSIHPYNLELKIENNVVYINEPKSLDH